ncbi:MAG: ABC transporter permease [Ruminococcaceae bacterium]|nr:ABC transporter permease [Oscillospiraceae bacterium]
MLKYTLRKLLVLIPKLLTITILLFFILELLPGDALSRTMNPMTYNELTEIQREEYREVLGLNDPAIIRYFRWLGGVLQGNLGYSTSTKQPIAEVLAARLPATMELAAYSLVISAIIGILFGFLSAVFKNSVLDYSLNTISVLGISLPEFFYGIVFMILFSLKLGLLPSGGRLSPTDSSFWTGRLPYMILPIGTMVFGLVAALQRYTRTTMLDVMGKDYIKTARSKGLSETTVYVKHGLRNAMTPVMTLLVMRLPRLVGGSVVIEQIFAYSGVGTMSLTASLAGDLPVVLVGTLLTGAMTLIASTLVDLFTALLDPRVRFE